MCELRGARQNFPTSTCHEHAFMTCHDARVTMTRRPATHRVMPKDSPQAALIATVWYMKAMYTVDAKARVLLIDLTT